MFTGLIETVGILQTIKKSNDVWLLTFRAPSIYDGLHLGDSVAIMGACCTVVSLSFGSFSVEIMQETINKTKLSLINEGDHVNLERAMLLTSRLDGHIVSGHVDGMGRVSKIESFEKTKIMYFSAEKEILYGIVPKGSITIDGVSLTVVDATDEYFSVSLIPTTIKDTTLSSLITGDVVNLETDIIGKYIKKFIKGLDADKNKPAKGQSNLSMDKLLEYGW
ncbi:MAG: riboflavin synthase [Synergistaceae bacterium]